MGVVIKETIRTSIVNYLGVILGVVNVLWLQASILSEGEIGVIKYLLDWSFLILPFVVLGANSLPIRFIHRFSEGKELNQFLSFVLLIPIFTSVILGILFFLFKEPFYAFLGDEVLTYESYFVYLIPLIFAHTYLVIFEGVLQSKADIFYSSILKNVFIRVVFMGLLLLHKFDVISFSQLFQLYVLGFVLELVLLFVYFKKHVEFRFELNLGFLKHPLKKEVISYSLFLIVGSGGLVLMNRIDVLMIADLMAQFGEVFNYVGVYAVSFFIAAFIEMPKKVITQLLYPALSKLATENNRDEMQVLYKQSAINLSIIGLFLFLGVWYNLDYLFNIIPNGDVFEQGKWVVFFIGVSKLSEMFFGVSQEVLIATKYYRYNLYLIPLLIIVTIISNYVFIPIYGITGAALATAITAVLYSLSRFLVIIYLLKMNSLTFSQLKVMFVLLIVVLVFWLKPQVFNSNFLEIILNSVIISVVFIGGNFVLKTSQEMNALINKFLKLGR